MGAVFAAISDEVATIVKPHRIFALVVSVAIIAAVSGGLVENASAAATSGVTAGGPGAPVTGTLPGGTTETFYAQSFKVQFAGDDGSIHTGWAYCVDIHNPMPIGTTGLSQKIWANARAASKANLGQILWILKQYPAEVTAANHNNDEAAAVQAAIWHLSDGFNLTYANASTMALYNQILAASAGKSVAEPNPAISVSPNTANAGIGGYAKFTIKSTASSPVSLALSATNGDPIGDSRLVTCDAAHTPIGNQLSGPFPTTVCVTRSTAGRVRLTATAVAYLPAGQLFTKAGVQEIIIAGDIVPFIQSDDGVARFGNDGSGTTTTTLDQNPPTVRIACPSGYEYNRNYTITARVADLDGDAIVNYRWELNGTGQSGPNASFNFTSAPGQTIRVTVTDATGLTGTDSITCTPGNHDPIVSLVCPTNFSLGATATWTATASDPDGDAIHYFWSVNGDPIAGNDKNTYTSIYNQQVVAVYVTDGRNGSSGKPVAVDCTLPTTTTTAPTTTTTAPTTTTTAPTTTTTAPTTTTTAPTTTTTAPTTTTTAPTTTTTTDPGTTTTTTDPTTTTTVAPTTTTQPGVLGTVVTTSTTVKTSSSVPTNVEASTLARTGSNSTVLAGLALVLLAGGSLLLIVSRRYRH